MAASGAAGPTRWQMVQIALVLLPFVLFLFRRPLRRLGARVWRGIWPWFTSRRFVWKSPDGSMVGKCPRCERVIPYAEIKKGGKAFQCPHCGESATWC